MRAPCAPPAEHAGHLPSRNADCKSARHFCLMALELGVPCPLLVPRSGEGFVDVVAAPVGGVCAWDGR